MTDCPRFGKLFNGCKFEARYDTVSRPNAEFKTNDAELMSAFFHGVGAHKTYVHDICIRCGHVVKRS